MNSRELAKLGVPEGKVMKKAFRALKAASKAEVDPSDLPSLMRTVVEAPAEHVDDPVWGELAAALVKHGRKRPAQKYIKRSAAAPFQKWGRDLDPNSIRQMEGACALPISVRGALMPDAHFGYGLPIGGVLATRGAVIPYAVGVDIACRMKMTVLDLPVAALAERGDQLRGALESETRFGVGASFKQRRQHRVMDDDWRSSKLTREVKDRAHAQLGTSGSGNHFVEFGELEVERDDLPLDRGSYLALLSHSGSRGAGNLVATHFSKVAMSRHPELPKELRHLAWLDLESGAGQEYWQAMQLMGRYAAANHELIHRHVARHLGVEVLLDVENHHNYAWIETHDGEEVVVHRKGATPAGEGVLGIIPGSMGTPAYVVRGKGSIAALASASHGAGRIMSRKAAKKTFSWREAQAFLDARGVTLLSAGLDEVPMVYKDIEAVMRAQEDLVEPLMRFMPRLVKMAP